jgi:hypothetical protein
VIERETRMTPFRQWAIANHEHVKFVFAIRPSQQLEHEKSCPICQAGLKIAVSLMRGEEIQLAVEEAVEAAQKVLVKRAKASE